MVTHWTASKGGNIIARGNAGSVWFFRNYHATATGDREAEPEINGEVSDSVRGGRNKTPGEMRLPLASFYMGNIRGLYPQNNQCKVPMLEEMIEEDNIYFVALTETHLNKNHLDAEIQMHNFTLFRADRKDRRHGGVALYLREDIAANAQTLISFSNGTTELLAVYLSKMDLAIIILYRPPNTTLDIFKEATTKIRSLLGNLPTNSTEVILTGDFNLPSITWTSMHITGGSRDVKQLAEELLDIINTLYLKQFIEEPTRGLNILDLLISNNFNLVHSYENIKTQMSDHNLINVRTTSLASTHTASH